MTERRYNQIDRFLECADNALRTLFSEPQPDRASPAAAIAAEDMSAELRALSAQMMRVNHTGEVCAQALSQGQALTAKLPQVRAEREQAAREEVDHLAWCAQRLDQLGSHTSYLNPFFYAASFTIGAAAGAISDRISLGFVAATEDQVCQHLDSHLGALPAEDKRSRAIVQQMREDEARHQAGALLAGGIEFVQPVKKAMTLVSRVMTETTSRI